MRRAFYGVPSKSAPQRKTPSAEPPKSGERRGCPQTHEIFFCQLKRKFVNLLPQRGKTPSAAGARRLSPKNQAFRSISFARFARRLFSLEKAKTTLFAFSPYAKAHVGKVNAARVLWCAPKRRAAEENSVRRAANKRRTQGFS